MKAHTADTLTQGQLREALDYDPATGLFTWREDRQHNAKRGGVAGVRVPLGGRCRHRFYWRLSLYNRAIYAHRAAFLWMTGRFPPPRLDHKNRNGEDNRWLNIRPCPSHAANVANTQARSHNKLGVKGVRKHWNRYVARIIVNRKEQHLGSFKTVEEAARAYDAAAILHHGEFAGVNYP